MNSSDYPRFVELGRRFHRLDRNARPEESAVKSYTAALSGNADSLSWDELLESKRAVVLGEAGSGKTRELEERAARIINSGGNGFFVRLDQLAGSGLTGLFDASEKERFERWRQGGETGWFFLDSVDEAKFHKLSDFHTALKRFRNDLGDALLLRTRILLSSRVSEWKPLTDGFEFGRLFPIPPTPAKKTNENVASADDNTVSELLVVQLEPLDRGQVETLATALGVSDAIDFCQELDRAFAWEFARRPLDVVDLAAFWNKERRIGSLRELIEFDLGLKLRPRESRDEFPLPSVDAREGAEWLAAASVLSRRFLFGVPDDQTVGSDALTPRECLPPEWNDNQVRALLNRAVFDSAVYGRLRFHHRRIGEYLAFRWLVSRMELGCPPHQLKQLLFENVMGRLVLRPSLRPIAAWFCTENQQWGQMVRQLVLDCAPSIHLTFGDPAALPVEYRRQILQALAKGATGRSHLWVDSSPDCLAKLAHPTLAKDIAQLVLDSDLAADLRIELLDVVRLGRLTECGFAAVQIAVLNGERSDLRSKAAEAVSALNEKLLTIRLIDAALQLPDLPSLFCSTLVTSFFPVAMSVDQLAALLSKSEPVAGNSIELPYFLKVHLQKVLLPDCAGALLERLVALVQSPPLIVSGKQTVPVSSQFYWVGQIFPAVLAHLFKKPDLSGEEAEAAAEAIRLIGHIREQCRFDREDLGELNKLTLLKPEVRRRYLWKMVEQFRADQKKEPTTSLAIFDHWETVRLVPDDFGWLIEEAKLRPDSIDRLFALRLATEVWDGSGRSVSGWWRLRRTASQDESLADAFGESATTGLLFPLRRFWWQKIYYRNWKWNARQRFQKGVAHVKWIREQLLLLRKLRFLASGKPIGWLVTLSREADEANNSHWAPGKWTDLEKKRGKWVARATQRGCIAAWRRFSPDLPHEKPEPNKTANGVLVGLAGLQLELSGNRQAVAKLSADEAVLATRYAVNELNDYPDWFGDLVENHPESVGRILSECINAEWLFPAVRKETHEVLARLSWSGGFRLSAVVELVTSLLKKGDPSNRAILNYCVTLVTRAPEPPLMVLAEIASTRITIHGRSDNSPFWLSVWLQTDAEAAIAHLEKRLSTWCDPDMLIVDICSILSGEGGTSRPYVENPSYLKVAALRRFLPLVFSHVRMSDDLNHRGEVYSPGPRDDAQRFRHMLLDRLENHEDPASIEALRDLSGEFAMKPIRDWILNIIEKRFAAEADLKPWTPADIREFAANFEIDPKDDRDLFAIALSRFQSLRWDVEESDNSARDELRKDDTEMILRRWLQRRLSERSRGRYAVPQEEEIDLQQRPDLRMQNPKANAVVSIEIKWADSWTLPVLLERLENQLIGQYLRSHNSRYGIYFLGFIGKKQHWEDPISGSRIDFDQVVELVRNRAIELMRSNPKIAGLEIVNINFTSPTKP